MTQKGRKMKQVTVRFNDQGEAELKKIQEMQGYKSAQAAVEHAVNSYRWLVDSERDLEKKLEDARAIIDYLEAQLKARA